MTDPARESVSIAGTVTVRYWASARSAAGVESDSVRLAAGSTLADALMAVRELHSDRPRLAEVVAVCSILVGDRPVGSADPATVSLSDGDLIELLPPFAGG